MTELDTGFTLILHKFSYVRLGLSLQCNTILQVWEIRFKVQKRFIGIYFFLNIFPYKIYDQKFSFFNFYGICLKTLLIYLTLGRPGSCYCTSFQYKNFLSITITFLCLILIPRPIFLLYLIRVIKILILTQSMRFLQIYPHFSFFFLIIKGKKQGSDRFYVRLYCKYC